MVIGKLSKDKQTEEASATLRLTRLIRFARLARLPKILNLGHMKNTMGFILKPGGRQHFGQALGNTKTRSRPPTTAAFHCAD